MVSEPSSHDFHICNGVRSLMSLSREPMRMVEHFTMQCKCSMNFTLKYLQWQANIDKVYFGVHCESGNDPVLLQPRHLDAVSTENWVVQYANFIIVNHQVQLRSTTIHPCTATVSTNNKNAVRFSAAALATTPPTKRVTKDSQEDGLSHLHVISCLSVHRTSIVN